MPQGELLTIVFVHGLDIGIGLVIACAFLRARVGIHLRIAALLASISAIAYWLGDSGMLDFGGPGWFWLTTPAYWLSIGVIGFVWLFLVVTFNDWRITPLTLAPIAVHVLTMLGGDAPARIAAYYDFNLGLYAYYASLATGAGLAAHALFIIVRGWRGDLVEARRRLRAPLLVISVAMCLYLIWLAGSVTLASFGVPIPSDNWNMLAETLITLAAAFVLMEARGALFGPSPAPRPADNRAEAADKKALEKLTHLMEKGEAWRREGLSIATLASEIGVGEQRLRRIINGRLGHRNFAAFVNAYRIEAAKARLADPAKKTVAEIAFDLGYASLGPFNRAFKDSVGQTPTEWRKAQAGGEP